MIPHAPVRQVKGRQDTLIPSNYTEEYRCFQNIWRFSKIFLWREIEYHENVFQNIEDYEKEYDKMVITDFQEKKKRGGEKKV